MVEHKDSEQLNMQSEEIILNIEKWNVLASEDAVRTEQVVEL